MANKNQVTLTFAGDTKQATQAFAEVGTAAGKMENKVKESAHSFDSVGEGFDRAESKAMGFRDTVTGVQDSVAGFGAILKGDFSAGALVTAGAGIGDLASGFSNLLVPAMKTSVEWLGKTKVGQAAVAAATKVWTGIQAAFNIVMSLNPIGLIVIAVIALIAVIVLIATKTKFFQTIWKAVWTFIKDKAADVWDWLKGLPDKLGNVFKKVRDFITAPFKAAFNFVADAWNNTIGKLQWSVPSWVPFIGGNTIGAPQLPHFHSGGVVPGSPGSETLAVLQAGERVTPAGAPGGTTELVIRSGGSKLDDAIVEIIARAVRQSGPGVINVRVANG